MTTSAVQDYLSKQLFIEKSIVTYRSLSRALGLHVNAAKNELVNYCDTVAEKPAVTYQITGEVRKDAQDSMAVDADESQALEEGEEEVRSTTSRLVGEKDLKDVQDQFARIHSLYVYCLSPSPLLDAGLICGPTESVRQTDNAKNPEYAASFGKIIGSHVQTGPVASSSRIAAPSNVHVKVEQKAKEKEKEPDKSKPKPMATGKLDFGKAKLKEPHQQETRKDKDGHKKDDAAKAKQPTASSSAISTKSTGAEESERVKRRKSGIATIVDSGEESAASPPSPQPPRYKSARPKAGARVSKGAVLSDDDEPTPPPRRKGKGKDRAVSEKDRELRELMEVDDGQVVRVSRAEVETLEEEEEGEEDDKEKESAAPEDEDVHMSDQADIAPKQARKKKVKKVIPVGRNGLKKKRVVKSRMKVDEKGYMVTEDYSEYESVDEEEPEPTKDKGRKEGSGTDNKADKSSKGKGSKKSAQSNLANFFGAPAKAIPKK